MTYRSLYKSAIILPIRTRGRCDSSPGDRPASQARPDLSFWRDNHGREVDFLCDEGGRLHAIEAKSALTVTPSSLKGLLDFARIADSISPRLTLVTGGDQAFASQGAEVRGWLTIADAIRNFG